MNDFSILMEKNAFLDGFWQLLLVYDVMRSRARANEGVDKYSFMQDLTSTCSQWADMFRLGKV